MRRYFVLSLGSVLAGAMLDFRRGGGSLFPSCAERQLDQRRVQRTAFVGTTTPTTLMTRI